MRCAGLGCRVVRYVVCLAVAGVDVTVDDGSAARDHSWSLGVAAQVEIVSKC